MKKQWLFLFAIAGILRVQAQYTDIINSNQPGNSMSAYSVGTKVLQAEGGLWFEQRNHKLLKTEQSLFGFDYSVRYGAFFEQLEFIASGRTIYDYMVYNPSQIPVVEKKLRLYNHSIGAKYLVYHNSFQDKPNLYSWKANHRFSWRNLIPSVAVYAGANIYPNPYYFYDGISTISPRAVISLQMHPQPRMVFVVNLKGDYLTDEHPMYSFVGTMTHNVDDGRFSIFLEGEGVQSDFYSDVIFRFGGAYLFITDLQVNLDLGVGIKDTPSRYMALAGISYRWDKHDKYKNPEEEKQLKEKKQKATNKKKFLGIF